MHLDRLERSFCHLLLLLLALESLTLQILNCYQSLLLTQVRFQPRLRQSCLRPVLMLRQNHRWKSRSLLLKVRQMLEPRPKILLLMLLLRHC
jgi:hypothetical protein